MNWFIFIFFLVIMLTLVFISYHIINLLRINSKILLNFNGNLTKTSIPLVYTNKMDGKIFPNLSLKDKSQRSVSINIKENKETIILLTSAGCPHCSMLLEYVKKYNLSFLKTEIIIISFFYPGLPQGMIDDYIETLKKVRVNHHYFMYGEENLKKLNIDGFPAIIKVGKDGRIISVYKANIETIDQHLHFI